MSSSSGNGAPKSCLDFRTNDASKRDVWDTVGSSDWDKRG